MTTALRGRHRSARRPSTPLTTIVNSAAGSAQGFGRKSVVVAASSGLVFSLAGALPAVAADAGATNANIQAVTGSVRTALQTAPVVVVDANIEWTVDSPELKFKAAPEVEAPVAAAPRIQQAASRSTQRATPAATSSNDSTPPQTQTKTVKSSDQGDSPSNNDDGDTSDVVAIAKRYVGVPYVYGGSTPNGFDCSGFTSYVFAKLGINLPRTSSAQRNVGRVVSAADAKPGDLIWSPGHIAIYVGNGMMIDAPRPGKSVQVRKMYQSNPRFIRVTG